MSRSTLSMACCVCCLSVLSASAMAAPLGLAIEDHKFTFNAPYFAGPVPSIGGVSYDYRGAEPDRLSLLLDDNHYAVDYTYCGSLPTVNGGLPPPPASALSYPLFAGGQFGAKLSLQMDFTVNDGPYVSPSGDVFDVSLVGHDGLLTVTGWVGTRNLPISALYPTFPDDTFVQLQVRLETVTLLARAGERTARLEGVGEILTLLGLRWSDVVATNPALADSPNVVVVMEFSLAGSAGQGLFPLPGGSGYDPLADYGWSMALGSASGQAGVPEPVTAALLALGGLGVLGSPRRRARR